MPALFQFDFCRWIVVGSGVQTESGFARHELSSRGDSNFNIEPTTSP
jgi:hypothetical protein